MKHLRKNDGFTLVELMVTLVIGTLIMASAVTILLLGLRVNKQGTETVSQQNTTRILLTALEDMATEGSIKKVELKGNSWVVYGEGDTGSNDDDVVLFSYSASDETVYAGELPKTENGITTSGAALLEGVISSYVELNDSLLTFSVETKDGIYNSSIYCRQAVSSSGSTDSGNHDDAGGSKGDTIIGGISGDSYDTSTSRAAFLKILASQYGSEGEIKGGSPGQTFSLWYCGGVDYWDGWNAQTPWCATFISWALEQLPYTVWKDGTAVPKFANVDNFLADFVKKGTFKRSEAHKADADAHDPNPGDLIFFDWIVNSEANAQHVGVVLTTLTEDGTTYVYTIEGNTDSRVAVRKYKLDDPRILGYGVLDWK